MPDEEGPLITCENETEEGVCEAAEEIMFSVIVHDCEINVCPDCYRDYLQKTGVISPTEKD